MMLCSDEKVWVLRLQIYIIDTLQDGWGYDFRANMSVAWEEYGNYATDVFTREAVNIIEVLVYLYLAIVRPLALFAS